MNPFIFGTMRMNEKNYSFNEWVDFFKYLYFSLKINWLHASNEYDSFDLLCDILRKIKVEKGIHFKLIVKLGEPHFDDHEFCPKRLEEKVSIYNSNLPNNSINIVQWMWRSYLDNDKKRLKFFLQSASSISKQFNSLKEKGLVKKFYCFPYTIDFAERAEELNIFDGYTLYRNKYENEYSSFINKLDKGQIISIRPFYGGIGFKDGKTFSEMIDFNINHRSINKIILTATENKHLLQVKNYLDEIPF
jgi:hypothetical protein